MRTAGLLWVLLRFKWVRFAMVGELTKAMREAGHRVVSEACTEQREQ
jgi:hypothetical protein